MSRWIIAVIYCVVSIFPLFCEDASHDGPKKFRDKEVPLRFRGEYSLTTGYIFDFVQEENSTVTRPLHENFRINNIIFTTAVNYEFIIPVIRHKHPIFSENNVTLTLHTRLSPATMNYTFEASFTPVGFYVIGAGGTIGTGWAIPGLGNPLARNKDGIISNEYFLGPVTSVYINQKLQFDFAYLFPEKYQRNLHFFIRASCSFIYRDLLTVSETQPYKWGDSDGDTLDGWLLRAQFVTGYMIHIIEEKQVRKRSFLPMRRSRFTIIAAMMHEVDEYNMSRANDSPMASSGWGSDFVPLIFSPILRFELPNNFFINTVVQCSNSRLYTPESVNEPYYQDRVYQGWYVHIKRLVIDFGFTF